MTRLHERIPRGIRRSRRPLALCAAAAAVAATFAVYGGATSSASPRAHGSASSIEGLYGSLPPVGSPSKGGTITIGQLTGSTPTFIFPVTPAADGSVYT